MRSGQEGGEIGTLERAFSSDRRFWAVPLLRVNVLASHSFTSSGTAFGTSARMSSSSSSSSLWQKKSNCCERLSKCPARDNPLMWLNDCAGDGSEVRNGIEIVIITLQQYDCLPFHDESLIPFSLVWLKSQWGRFLLVRSRQS